MQIIQTKPLISTLLARKTLKQVEYQSQKPNGRHHILAITEGNELAEMHLTPDFTQVTDSRIIMKFEKCQQMLLFKDLVFALFNDRIEITKNEKTTEFRVQATSFDVCEMRRELMVERQLVRNDALIKKIRIKKQVQSACYKVVYVTDMKESKCKIESFFVNDELQIVKGQFQRLFPEQVSEILCTPELVFLLFPTRVLALGESGSQTLKSVNGKEAKITKESKQFQPLCLQNQNTQLSPLEHEFGPCPDALLTESDEILDKIHRKLENPEFALELSEAGLNIEFQRTKRAQFDSSLMSIVEQQSLSVFEVREGDAQIMRQLYLKECAGEPFFHGVYLHVSAKQQSFLSCLNLYEDQDLRVIDRYDTNKETIAFTQLSTTAALISEASGDLVLVEIAPALEVVGKLQNQLNFDPALGLLQAIPDPAARLLKSKQLHAQKAFIHFSELEFKDSMRFFLLSKVDPTCVLYLYSHPSFELASADVAKQEIFAEQLLSNLPQQFVLPEFDIDALRHRENAADLITDGIDEFRAYIHTWRADFFAEPRDLSMQEQKMLANVDESLLKSFLKDPRGVDDREINQILENNELNIEIENAISLLQGKYEESLIMLLKNKRKHEEALEMILGGQAINAAVPMTVAREIAAYFIQIGLGDSTQEVSSQIKKLHSEYYQCLYYTDPEFIQEIYKQIPGTKTHQLDIMLALEFLEYEQNQTFPEYGDGFELLDYKAKLIETSLSSGNFYEQTREDVLVALVRIYVEIVQREAQKVEYAISEGEQWKEIYNYLEQTIPVQALKIKFDQQENINFQEFLIDVEDELFSRSLPLENGALPQFPRALSEDIEGRVGQMRRRLTKLIESLENVDYEKFLDALPKDSFLEDQAVLQLKKYSFEIGLSIIAQALGRPSQAESICDSIYSDSTDASVENREFDIFLIFLKTFLNPVLPPEKPFVEAALSLILRRFSYFPPLETIELLRTQALGVKIADILPYLRVELSRAKTAECELGGISAVLSGRAEFQRVQLSQLRQARTEISQTERCMVCADLLRRDVVVFENGRVVCSKCWMNPDKCEVVRRMKPASGYQAFGNVFE